MQIQFMHKNAGQMHYKCVH